MSLTAASRWAFLAWPRNPVPMEGEVMNVMLVGIGVTIVGVLGMVGWLLWKKLSTLEARLSPQPSPVPDPPLTIGRIHEDPLPAGKEAYAFWQSVHRMPAWQTLSHIHQADTRNYLRKAKDMAESGNQAGALFYLGMAHEAAFDAVKPEAQVQRALKAMVEQQRQVSQETAETKRDMAFMRRPGDRWTRGSYGV